MIVIAGSRSETRRDESSQAGFESPKEKAGLVERHPHPKDRRGTVLLLTKLAMQKLPLLFESLGNAMLALISGYSQRELAVLADFFARASILWQKEREKLQARSDDMTP